MIAAVFPGQGAEAPGMAGWALARSPAARALVERAGEAAGCDAARVLARGGPAFYRTETVQPLLTAACLAIFELLLEVGVPVQATAGHSLGELAAWSAAGGIAPERAVDLAAARGRAMGEQARRAPGGMVSIRAPRASLDAALAARPELALAAENGPDLWAVSGPVEVLQCLWGGMPNPVQTRRLPATGPWHHPVMGGAAPALRAALDAAPSAPLTRRWISGLTGAPAAAQDVPEHLLAQLTAPARWSSAMSALDDLAHVADEQLRVIAVGPGRELTHLVRANLPQAQIYRTDTARDFDATVAALAPGPGATP